MSARIGSSDLAFFLAAMIAVNSIDRKAKKEASIRTGGTDLWAI
jgi:hypothetical protein